MNEGGAPLPQKLRDQQTEPRQTLQLRNGFWGRGAPPSPEPASYETPLAGSTRKAERSGCSGLKNVAVWVLTRHGEGS